MLAQFIRVDLHTCLAADTYVTIIYIFISGKEHNRIIQHNFTWLSIFVSSKLASVSVMSKCICI